MLGRTAAVSLRGGINLAELLACCCCASAPAGWGDASRLSIFSTEPDVIGTRVGGCRAKAPPAAPYLDCPNGLVDQPLHRLYGRCAAGDATSCRDQVRQQPAFTVRIRLHLCLLPGCHCTGSSLLHHPLHLGQNRLIGGGLISFPESGMAG